MRQWRQRFNNIRQRVVIEFLFQQFQFNIIVIIGIHLQFDRHLYGGSDRNQRTLSRGRN